MGLVSSIGIVVMIVAACGGGSDSPTAAQQSTAAPTAAPTSAAATAVVQATAAPRPTAAAVPTATAVPVATGSVVAAMSSLSNFETLDPSLGAGRVYMDSMFDYEIGATNDAKLDFNSGFVRQWSISPDGKVHTFKLRDNIVFHNGDKATSKDSVYGVDFIRREGSQASSAPSLRATIASMETPDETTMVLNLKTAQIYWHVANFSRLIGGGTGNYLYPSVYMQRVGYEAANRAPIGSGPFKFKGLTVGDKITYEAVDRHWYWGVPRVKTLEWRLIPEEAVRIAVLRTGDADVADASRGSVDAVKKAGGLRLISRNGSGVAAFRFEAQYKTDYPGYGPNPLAKKEVRQALGWYAIDRQALVDTFMMGLASPSIDYPVPFGDPASLHFDTPKFDQAKAKQILAQAGYPNGFEIDMYLWSLRLPEASQIMEAIAVWWEQIGIKIKRQPMEFAAYRTKLAGAKGWDRPSVSGAWFQGGNPVSGVQAATNHDPGQQFAVIYDPELDKLAKTWAASSSEADYIKNGQAYAKATYESVGATGGGVSLLSMGEIFVAGARVPATWNLGAATHSYQIEQIGLRPK